MRIAIVNDLAMAVEALRRVLTSAAEIELAWIARDGAEAVEKCRADTPDLILMDLIMPVMDGVEATRRIMAATPCAVLVVTATVEGNASKVFDAMGHGALDAVNTPALGASGATSGGADLLAKISMIAKLIGRPMAPPAPARAVGEAPIARAHEPPLVVIGASTGGPAALATLLASLPADFPAATVVIQHVDVQFATGLARWLDGQTPLEVRVASPGDRPAIGSVLVAASNDHLSLTPSLTLEYTAEPVDYPYRPSVDVFFSSVASHWPHEGIAVTLTGMGHDGAAGMLDLRRAGWHTIAQDEASSLIYGMPKACAEANAAIAVLPLSEIAAAVTGKIRAPGR